MRPDPMNAHPDGWYRHCTNRVGGLGPVDDKTVLVGHGVGCSTALRVGEKHGLHSIYFINPCPMKKDSEDFDWQAISENVEGFFGIFGATSPNPDFVELIKKEPPPT
ncbi:hypothetical protein TrLO_g12063 [Triparma laevis f. longispina]|uniref:Uncharacterized protein n=1 Tax=Triparma laevis f. longispina TaxID=1714387 RepID=A0A9W7EBZ4_9STRA|nr:hypothetical protein TrLO_g12063 [Triparma laevis f. longispina]